MFEVIQNLSMLSELHNGPCGGEESTTNLELHVTA